MEKGEVERLILQKSNRLSFRIHKDKSEAWKCFFKVSVDDVETSFVKCNECSKIVKYVPGHGTGSMLSHIKSCKHKTEKKQNTLDGMAGFFPSPMKRSLSTADKSDLTDCLAHMCAKDMR
jgi:hypothetical protein